MAYFTPVSAAIGGVLIGVATVLFVALNGRLAGISGVFAGALAGSAGERPWRLAFIAGLVLAPVSALLTGYAYAAPRMPASWSVIIISGLLVGFGTRLANGCTSGHGICGIAQLSPRSLVATGVFMVTAIAVVAVMRHGLGG